MTTMLDLPATFSAATRDQSSVVPYGRGQLLTLPWSFGDGESVSLYIEEVGSGYLVSDRGLAASQLAIAGVDLSTRSAGASWRAVRNSVDAAPSPIPSVDDFEIAAFAEADNLGITMTAVGEAVLRADGLRALAAPPRAATFSERVIRNAAERGVTVLPRARLKTRHGGERHVTCRVEGRRWAYVQALGVAGGPNDAYDRTRSVFADADVSSDRLVAIVADDARLAAWQEESLHDVGTVVHEREQEEFWASVA